MGRGILWLGPCYGEVASDPYQLAPAPSSGTSVQPGRC